MKTIHPFVESNTSNGANKDSFKCCILIIGCIVMPRLIDSVFEVRAYYSSMYYVSCDVLQHLGKFMETAGFDHTFTGCLNGLRSIW